MQSKGVTDMATIKHTDGIHSAMKTAAQAIKAGAAPSFSTASYEELVLGQMVEYGYICEATGAEGVAAMGTRIALTAKGLQVAS